MERCAVITGSTGKLGSSTALALGEAGYNCVCLCGRKTAQDNLASAFKQKGMSARFVKVDLSSRDIREDCFKTATSILASGCKEVVLVNSASMFVPDTDVFNLEPMLRVNSTSPVELTKMLARQKSFRLKSVVNITDIGARLRWPSYSTYCRSKALLESSTLRLAAELAPHTRVNAVAPGLIDSDGLSMERYANLLTKIPLGRSGTHEEITQVVLMLLANDYITGQIISVDGGRSLYIE
jgi:pteridine reductase